MNTSPVEKVEDAPRQRKGGKDVIQDDDEADKSGQKENKKKKGKNSEKYGHGEENLSLK